MCDKSAEKTQSRENFLNLFQCLMSMPITAYKTFGLKTIDTGFSENTTRFESEEYILR